MKSYKKQSPNEKPRTITDKLLSRIVKDYKSGKSTYQISNKYRITVGRISRAIKRTGIDPRENRDSLRLAYIQGRMSRNKKWKRLSEWGEKRILDTRSGYVFVRCPDHYSNPPNGYVREHLLVWERHNKKKLPKGWHIHHINGVKDDNRQENLLALSAKNHANFIPKLYKKIKELEEELATERRNQCRNLCM